MLVRKQGLSLKQAGKICVLCYTRFVALLWNLATYCCGWGSIAKGGALYDIYLLYMYISYIIIHRIYSRHKVGLTWDLKPITLDLCSDSCSTELSSLTQERSVQSMFTQEVTSKNTKLYLNVGNWEGLTPPKVTLCLIYFHYCTTLF